MREKAIVVSSSGKRAKVRILRRSACDKCNGCDVGRKNKTIHVWANNHLNAKSGQTVEIELRPATMLKATFIAYAIPLLSFILGIGFGNKLATMLAINLVEVFALFTGVLLMGISFYCVHLYNKRVRNTAQYNSDIVNIL